MSHASLLMVLLSKNTSKHAAENITMNNNNVHMNTSDFGYLAGKKPQSGETQRERDSYSMLSERSRVQLGFNYSNIKISHKYFFPEHPH